MGRTQRDGSQLDEARIQRCRAAKAALRAVLRPGESALGGPARQETQPALPVVQGHRVEIPRDVLASLPSPLPPALQRQRVLRYDTARYPFRELVAEILGVEPKVLPQLHRALEGPCWPPQPCPGAAEPQPSPGAQPQRARHRASEFNRRWHQAKGSQALDRFQALLGRFVSEVVAPQMQERAPAPAEEQPGAAVAYQRRVTFRVQEPADRAMGCLHSDAEYGHPPAEVNWWLPVTRVWGANTLHIESEPGKGDFEPAELDYGQVLRFYGNRCQHYTVANTTGSCRVSFDFRVLPLLYHDPQWRDPRGQACTFEVGPYYQLAEPSGPEAV